MIKFQVKTADHFHDVTIYLPAVPNHGDIVLLGGASYARPEFIHRYRVTRAEFIPGLELVTLILEQV